MSVDSVNPFGGFAPFPNTIGTALMSYQNELIGFSWGYKRAYAERLIGALSNEQFNGLTIQDVANTIEQHNNDVINRMQTEMPKWLAIQNQYIEASVQVEIAKANRTPSAFREIFGSFADAFSQQQMDDVINFFGGNPENLKAITSASPLLGVMSLLNQSGSPTIPPQTETAVLRNWESIPASHDPNTRCCTSNHPHTRNYEFDANKKEDLLTLKNNKLQELDAKWNGQLFNRSSYQFCSTNTEWIADTVTFIRTLDEWHYINDGSIFSPIP